MQFILWTIQDSEEGAASVKTIHETLHKSPNVVVQRLWLLILNIQEIVDKDTGMEIGYPEQLPLFSSVPQSKC
jgi:hypothetical protein